MNTGTVVNATKVAIRGENVAIAADYLAIGELPLPCGAVAPMEVVSFVVVTISSFEPLLFA